MKSINIDRLSKTQKVLFYLLFGICYILSAMPMWLLHAVSSSFFVIVYHIARYRRKMVRKNLHDSFPNKTEKDIIEIERKFYHHFCDIFMESVKYFSISHKDMRKRMQFKGTELICESFRKGKSCGVFLGHYANWEWISSLPLWIDQKLGQCTQLYHPLENPVFDCLVGYTRERLGGKSIPVNESIRHLVKFKNEGRPFVIGFIADQVPLWNNIHYWTNFLNHPETPIFTGAEKLMRKLDMDVFYLEVRKVKRGYYEAEFKPITTNPNSYKEFELTEVYTKMLNETITKAPSYWLWTHNRWKRTKAEWDRIIKRQ